MSSYLTQTVHSDDVTSAGALFVLPWLQMVSSGMAELSSVDDLGYVRDALLPGHTDTEATATFKRSAPHTPTPSHPHTLP